MHQQSGQDDRVRLCFKVNADIVVEGRQQPLNDMGVDPQMPTKFMLAAWIGGGNNDLSLYEISPTGMSGVELDIRKGDVNTLKLGVSFNIRTPSGGRNCHLASSFVPISYMKEVLECSDKWIALSDNFSRGNKAILRITNNGTDLSQLAGLPLRESVLMQMNEVSQAVHEIGTKLQGQLQTLQVSATNAGPQYVNAFTYCHMQGMLSHYALLGHLLRSMPSPIGLEWISYAAYQTVQSTALHPRLLQGMAGGELVARYGSNLVSRLTACELTAPYSPDVTIGMDGRVTKPTEDIQRSFCGVQLRSQGDRARYQPPVGLHSCCGGDDCRVEILLKALQQQADPAMPDRMSMTVCADDCENQSQMAMQIGDALRKIYLKYESDVQGLATDMQKETNTNHLFAGINTEHHRVMAPVLLKLGKMLHDGEWCLDLGVVSAKGPSCDLNANAPELCGHGTVISRYLDAGMMVHVPNEGTTYMTVDADIDADLTDRLQVRLTNGMEHEFSLAEFQTVLAQNMHEIAGIKPRPRILAHLANRYNDPVHECPFYVAMFYSGLRERDNSLGCIPIEKKGKATFGAPVMGLSNPTTMALPVQIPEKLEQLLTQQADEAWSPAADATTMKTIASFWHPVRPPHKDDLRQKAGNFMRAECTWGFDNPEHTKMAVGLYAELANQFNALQEKDEQDDGARLSAYGQFMSATLRWVMDIPKQKASFTLTTARNLALATKQTPDLLALVQQSHSKHVEIGERANVESAHHFYMCQDTRALVHSHRVKLM